MSKETFVGRSAAEAAIKACERLGVSRAQLKYDLISEEGEGLTRRVVIAVDGAVADLKETPAVSSNPVDMDVDDGYDDDEPPRRDEIPDRNPEGADRSNRNGRGRRGSRRNDRSERSERNDRNDREQAGRGNRSRGEGGRSRRGSRDKDRSRQRTRRGGSSSRDDGGIDALLNLNVLPPPDYEPRAQIDGELSARAGYSVKIISETLERLNFSMEVVCVQDDEEEIHFDLRGDALKQLIGEKGEPLLALQFLVNRMVDRGDAEGEQHIVLDAAGYRHRRRTALSGLATKLAERAKEEGKVVRLSPMSAHDRRIFHITLQEVEGISTRSQGGGLYRPLLVIPDHDEQDEEDFEDDE